METSNGNDLKNNDKKEICECRHWGISQGNVLQRTYRENEHGELMSEKEIVIGEFPTDQNSSNVNEYNGANYPNNTTVERTPEKEV